MVRPGAGLGGRRPRPAGHPRRRPADLPQGLDRTEEPQPEHQRPDEYRRDRRRAHRPVAGSGDGQRAVRHRRVDRGEVPGSRAQRHPRPAATGSGTGHRAGRRRMEGTAGQASGTGSHRAREARRTHRPRRRGDQRPLQRQPGADHRRKPAGGEGGRRAGVRRQHQRRGRAGVPRHPPRRRQHPGPDHPRRGGSPGFPRTDPAFRRQFRPRLHPGGIPHRPRHRGAAAAAVRRRLAGLDLPRPGAAGDRLSLRAGDLHPGDHRQRPFRRGAPGHPDQGRGVPRTRAQAVLGRPRQDRHHHPWQTATDRLPADRGG